MLQNNSSIRKQRRNVKILSFLFFVAGQILNYLIIEPSLNYLTNMTNPSTIVHGFGILITVVFVGYLILKLYQWHKEDEQLKREDFIDKLTEILEAQKNLAEKSITLHVQDLKGVFLKEIREALSEDEIDKEELIKKLDHDFKHHHIAFNANLEKIEKLKARLKRHKSTDIIEEIRAENTLEKTK